MSGGGSSGSPGDLRRRLQLAPRASAVSLRPLGLMDKASDFQSEDCGFESRRGCFLNDASKHLVFHLTVAASVLRCNGTIYDTSFSRAHPLAHSRPLFQLHVQRAMWHSPWSITYRHAGYNSVGKTSDGIMPQQSYGPWLDP